MERFGRSLPPKGLQALHNIVARPNDHWWKDLLSCWQPAGYTSTAPLRLAIRRNALNFYRNGQSLGEVRFRHNGDPYCRTHAKYAFKGTSSTKYVELSGEHYLHPECGEPHRYAGLPTLTDWTLAAEAHAGEEKRLVEQLVAANSTIIDLEIGLPAFDQSRRARRIDLVALEEQSGRIRLVFWEVKLIHDPRLVSRSHPRVLQQLDDYQKYLEEHKQVLVEAYASACRLLHTFHSMAAQASTPRAPLDPLLRAVLEDPALLILDPQPRLLIHDSGHASTQRHSHLASLQAQVPIQRTQGSGPHHLGLLT